MTQRSRLLRSPIQTRRSCDDQMFDCDRRTRGLLLSATATRRRELFGAVCDLLRPDLIAWLRGYVRRHPEPRNPRTREARRWLASLEGAA